MSLRASRRRGGRATAQPSWLRGHPAILGALGLAVIAGLVLAAFRIDDLPLIGGGTTYHAAFRDASGLAPGNEVRIAGVRVGKVTGVELARSGSTPYVRVDFRVSSDDAVLGDQTSATIRIKTVLGQKYLALDPAGSGRLAGGAEIPLDRTASPLDVVQAVNGLAATVQRIDVGQMAQAFTVLSQTFADTPDGVRASLSGLAQLSQTVASRDDALRQLLSHAHGVTGVLAQRDDELQKLVADATALLDEVKARSQAIHDLLTGTIALSTQLSGLVNDNRATLKPALDSLQGVVSTLQRDRDDLARTVETMAPFVDAFANVTGNGRWFDSWVNGLLQPYAPAVGK
jgi:phospholipid/cholesterol/gamma-HCH transport system substrate-binding protein